MNRRAIAILGGLFLLIVITLGVLIYQRSKTPATEVPIVTNQTPVEPIDTSSQTLPDVPNDTGSNQPLPTSSGRAEQLVSDQVISPVLFFQGDGVSYFTPDGNLVLHDVQRSGDQLLAVNRRTLSIPAKPGISKVLWPDAGNDFIVEFNLNGKRNWSYFNSQTQSFTDLPDKITSLTWLPGGQQIAYIWLDGGTSTFNISKPDNTNYQTLTDLYENNNEFAVSPDGKNVLYYQRENVSATNQIVLMSADGKNFKALVKDGYNFGVSWSPNSQGFVFGKRNPSTLIYDLYFGDIITGQTQSLGVATTIEKIVWDTDGYNLYAAVPQRGTIDRGLTEDTIYKINTTTLQKKEFNPALPVDARNLFLTNTGDRLLFKNLQDGGLYYMDVSGLYSSVDQ